MARKCVVTVGGATAERVLVVDPASFRRGGKHLLPPAPILAGGSAINHACRLLATGTSAIPIGPVCDDGAGQIVARALHEAAQKGGCASASPEELFVRGAGVATPFTTITTIGGERTIYTEFAEEMFGAYADHLVARLAALDYARVGAVMLGHIHADREGSPGRAGVLTQRVIHAFRAHGKPVFANFGASQYRQGADRWSAALPDVSCFQLDIDEARTFLGGTRASRPELREILDWFAARCTVIITLERMGAVGRRKGSRDVVLTWPYEIEVTDSTGAGDAFGAGAVSAMLDAPFDDDDALRAGMARGGLFAAYACTTHGGADHCPSTAELDAFRATNAKILNTEVRSLQRAAKYLRRLDQAVPARG